MSVIALFHTSLGGVCHCSIHQHLCITLQNVQHYLQTLLSESEKQRQDLDSVKHYLGSVKSFLNTFSITILRYRADIKKLINFTDTGVDAGSCAARWLQPQNCMYPLARRLTLGLRVFHIQAIKMPIFSS